MELARDPTESLVLLGAGASREAGLPLTHEMTQLIVDRVNQDSRMRFWGATTVLNFVCASLIQYDAARGTNPYDGLDVERVFSAVQMLSQRDELEISPFVLSWHPAVDRRSRPELPAFFGAHFKEAVLSTRGIGDSNVERRFKEGVQALLGTVDNSIYQRLMGSLTLHLRRILEIPDPAKLCYIKPLLQWALKGEHPTIATLNYDRSMETAGETSDVSIDTGIGALSASGRWSVAEGSIGLVKLHGSIDWEMKSVRDRSQPLKSEELVFREDWEEADFEPAIIFGRRGKLRVQGPYLELLRAFEDQLAVAKDLMVVGYSFRDEHINEYVRRWLNQDPGRRLTIIDPFFPERPRHETFQNELASSGTARSEQIELHRVGASTAFSRLHAPLG